jgi:hypothetical protein
MGFGLLNVSVKAKPSQYSVGKGFQKLLQKSSTKRYQKFDLNTTFFTLLIKCFAGESPHSRQPCSLLVLGFEAARI